MTWHARRMMECEMNGRSRYKTAIAMCPCHLRHCWLIATDARSLIHRFSILYLLGYDTWQLSELRFVQRADSNYWYVSKYHRRNDLRNIRTIEMTETTNWCFDIDPSVSILPFIDTRPTARLEFPGNRPKIDDSLCIIFTCPRQNR